MPDIAKSIVLEQGKTFADAQGDVHRGLQVVESATAITSNMLGDKLEVTKDMDTYSRRLPLGVCAAITPFNFPAMQVSSLLNRCPRLTWQDRALVSCSGHSHR
jgi:malonate-semialdehyde dehydrogenase (acetylating)/methylmalonate-semialdehyde dehydrogenase